MEELNRREQESISPVEIPFGIRIFVIAIAIIVPFIGPFTSIAVGLKAKERTGSDRLARTGKIMLGIHLLLGVCMIFLVPYCMKNRRVGMAGVAKNNLHAIQVSLMRYANDHNGGHPSDISALIDEWYVNYLPTNPYTGEPMRHIELEEGPQAGNFTYLPFFENDEAVSYSLIGYGDEYAPNMEGLQEFGFKQVIIVLDSGVGMIPSAPRFEDVFLIGSDVPVLLTNEHQPW